MEKIEGKVISAVCGRAQIAVGSSEYFLTHHTQPVDPNSIVEFKDPHNLLTGCVGYFATVTVDEDNAIQKVRFHW